MTQKKEVTNIEKGILRRMFIRSHLVFLSFNMVKMEANGFTTTMQPAIEEIYKGDEEGKKEAYKRHQSFFNTHAVPFSFIAGLSYAMEKEKKEMGTLDGKTIENIKASLMGPTAGMFDSLFFNVFRIIAAGIAIGLCAQGNILGTILFILIYGVTQSIAKYFLVHAGYKTGISFIDSIYNSGLMGALTQASSVLALIMVGAMTAQMVNVPLAWTINTGDTSVVVNDILNGIFPGLLSIVLLWGLVTLIHKKVRPTWLVLGILVVSMAGSALGIF